MPDDFDTPTNGRDLEVHADMLEDYEEWKRQQAVVEWTEEHLSGYPESVKLSWATMVFLIEDPATDLSPIMGDIIRQRLESLYEEVLNEQ